MKASEFLKKYEKDKQKQEREDHSLQHQARERAEHLEQGLQVGSPYDWEDLERYKKEMARMEKEGPGSKKPD
ncbi:peptidase S14 [Gilvimarinus sp. SDUM040013]|uniref:Peptidase S14 n=1 Tax=Gilvimarinus gilvus TaxID=3058038 RepID=A0ABU4RV94_9GAMM|nr:peptidase S14 [Gilvimarinus sp. SDUM040013]MDO3387841.1 peptidase S14 [Gilvimarinus sp. SDUM040013]MDX6848788.1 peptidase S14 [Gilvimarinus sp. SDUM040013]